MMNYDFLDKVLDDLGYTPDVEPNATIRRTVVELVHTLDAQNIASETDRIAATDLFANVVRLHAEGPKANREKEAVWVPLVIGEHRPGLTARVKKDAYGQAGAWHNGLVGTVTAIRGGRVLVQYTGRTDGIGHSHHPDKIEVLEK